jgi:very-short-patch-repair endonuclease
MTEYFNRPDEKALRQRLRKDMPPAEALLWSRLRGKQLLGLKFRRQYSVGAYCIDLYCPEIRVAIEVDGASHFTAEAKRYDARRETWIKTFGIRFLRFTDVDVHENLDGVLHAIAASIRSLSTDSPDSRHEESGRGSEA